MNRIDLQRMKGSPFYNVMLFSAFWALQLFITKLALNAGAQVLSYQLLSLLGALVILAILLLPRFGREFRSLFKDKPGLFWRLFFANGIQSGLGTCLSIIGISLTSAINAGFLVKLSTVTTVLFAWLILKERLTVIKILMVFSMLSGAYLLTTKGQMLLPRIGDLFIFGACLCWSLGNVLIRKYLKLQAVKIELVTFQKSLAGLPFVLTLVCLALWIPSIFGSLDQVLSCCNTPSVIFPYIIGNSVLLTFTWTYLNNTLKISSASYMTMMSMVTPVFVSLLAMVFLGERLVWIQVIGAGMIILSGVSIYFSGISTD
jgi:drug/metabolite transporter (DMT)-like permease